MNMRGKGLYLSIELLAKFQRITMVKIVKNTFNLYWCSKTHILIRWCNQYKKGAGYIFLNKNVACGPLLAFPINCSGQSPLRTVKGLFTILLGTREVYLLLLHMNKLYKIFKMY